MTKLIHNFSIKSIEQSGIFTGYANIFNVIDQHSDIVVRGAFGQINPASIKLLWQHDFKKPIGRILEIQEDEKGLYVKCSILLEIERGREIYTMLKEGIIDGLSIGYRPVQYKIRKKDNIRILSKVKILEVSLVTFPANPESRVTSIKNTNNFHQKDEINLHKAISNAITILKN